MRKEHKERGIVIALIVGFLIAMSVMTIAIYRGYSNAYRTNIELTTVTILGLPIYELTKIGSNYAGDTIGTNMGLFCGICMLISLLVKALISIFKKK